jgi:Glycosyltransferases involved in cell wall biogenesis
MAVEQTVSIVLPTYNRAATLRRAIDSVLRQTHRDFELIVVDDGSTDNTALILSEIVDPRIRIIRQANKGPGAARNAGIRAARYELVAFQDSDDVWFDDKLERQLAAMNDDIGVVYHDVICVKQDGEEELLSTPESIPLNIVDRMETAGQLGIVWCLTRKHLIEAVGGFDEVMAPVEDTDLLIKLRAVSEFVRVPMPLVYYFDSSDGITKNWQGVANSIRRLIQLHGKELAPFKPFVASLLVKCANLERKQREQDRMNLKDTLGESIEPVRN